MERPRRTSFRPPHLIVCALLLSALLMRGSPAQAQHVHNWSAYPAIWTSPPQCGEYARAGETIVVSVPPMNDADTCQNANCTFPPNAEGKGEAGNVVFVSGWSDGGAGGQFGKYVGSDWKAYPDDCTAADVTHYRCPYQAAVVSLTASFNDVPEAWDPVLGQYVTTADDAPATSNATRFTVWDFTISDGAAGWVPKVYGYDADADTRRSFTALISPATDHNGNSMAAVITFGITSSQEDGYCLNATRVAGQPDDTTGNDLKFFAADQPANVNVPNDASANTTAPVTTVEVVVRCLDYGANGSIAATALIPNVGCMTARLAVPAGSPPSLLSFAQMPVDTNLNFIADSDGYYDGNGAPASQDAEESPAGNGIDGDGLQRYEEYRGLRILDQHVRTSLSMKDLLIYSYLSEGLGYATNLPTTTHRIRAYEKDLSNFINENSGTDALYYPGPGGVLERSQKALDLFDYGYLARGVYGYAPPALHLGAQTPNCTQQIRIYVEAIREATWPNYDRYTEDASDAAAISMVIAHEVGHGVGMDHYTYAGTRLSVMVDGFQGWINADWTNIPTQYDATDLAQLQLHH